MSATSNNYRRFAQNPASEEDMNIPNYVGDYLTNTHKVSEFFAALEARAMAAASESVVAFNSYLTEETLQLSRFRAQQSRAQAALQSIHSRMAAKLDRFNAKKKASAVFFTLAAATSAACAAVTADLDHKRLAAAAAAAASILSAATGKWIDSVMKKWERGMKKEREIVRCTIVGGGFSIRNLAEIYELAQGMKSEAVAMSETVDDGRDRVAALKQRFQELQRKANQGGLDASFSREAVVESILRSLD